MKPNKNKAENKTVINVTNCGHFFCENCTQQIGKDKCGVCNKGPVKFAKASS